MRLFGYSIAAAVSLLAAFTIGRYIGRVEGATVLQSGARIPAVKTAKGRP